MVVHVHLELANDLPLACLPSSGLLRLTWQQLDTYIMDLGAGWPHTVPQRRLGPASSTATGVHPVVSGVRMGPAAYTPMTQCLLLDVYYKG